MGTHLEGNLVNVKQLLKEMAPDPSRIVRTTTYIIKPRYC